MDELGEEKAVLSNLGSVTKALQNIDCDLADAYKQGALAKECIRDGHDEWSKVRIRCLHV